MHWLSKSALLAKMADTIDEISGGRLILDLGAGWHRPEYRAFGYPYDHRVSRFEVAFVDFAGRHQELGFTELVVHWPIPGSDFAADEKVFEQIAMEAPAQLR